MRNIDETYKTELNFVDEFNLSRNGMIKEIEQEFNIIRLCLFESQELEEQYQSVLDRIIVMPLRKLLCEKASVLLNVCPTFKMPLLDGIEVRYDDGQHIVHTPLRIGSIQTWIPVEEWLKQNVSWFDRDVKSIAQMLPKYSYEYILNKLTGKLKELKSEFVERFPELSLFYGLSSPLDSEMICIFPCFCPCEESVRAKTRGILFRHCSLLYQEVLRNPALLFLLSERKCSLWY